MKHGLTKSWIRSWTLNLYDLNLHNMAFDKGVSHPGIPSVDILCNEIPGHDIGTNKQKYSLKDSSLGIFSQVIYTIDYCMKSQWSCTLLCWGLWEVWVQDDGVLGILPELINVPLTLQLSLSDKSVLYLYNLRTT